MLRLLGGIYELVPASRRDTLLLRWFTSFKIPLIAYLKPRILELNDQRCRLLVPLRRRAQNHHGSMYFGALAIAADAVIGVLAVRWILRSDTPISVIFKEARAQFLRRVVGDAVFTCESGEQIGKLVALAAGSNERVELNVPVVVTVPSRSGAEPVARYELLLSLKRRAGRGSALMTSDRLADAG
jgi:acyl-coenzyme A thioesterase PaaI-like protein